MVLIVIFVVFSDDFLFLTLLKGLLEFIFWGLLKQIQVFVYCYYYHSYYYYY